MILIRTDHKDFATYLASLSKPARKNYKAVTKTYDGALYLDWDGKDFPIDMVRDFMKLWSQQLIRGKTREWAFPVEHVAELAAQGNLGLFCLQWKGNIVGVQFIQRRDGYWDCHPPMYDKKKHPSLAKVMWFFLIKYAIRFKLSPLDMGGGHDDWRYHIEHRGEYPNGTYKWMYVPEKAKDDPSSEPAYYIERPSCSLRLKNS